MFLSYFIGETDVLIFNEKGSKVIQACTSRSYAHALSLNTERLVHWSHISKQCRGKNYPAFLPGLKYAVEIVIFYDGELIIIGVD